MKCALCQVNENLEESHIIPKFVFKSMKKNSPTGNIRSNREPNKKIQDGEKLKLLCSNCEDLLNIDETRFANIIYHKFQKDKLKEFEYDEWLERFIVSINWRILHLDISSNNRMKNFNIDTLENLSSYETELRKFLLNKIDYLVGIENHIFFFRLIESVSEEWAELKLQSAIGESVVGYTVVYENHSAYILVNLQGLLLITILKKSENDIWFNTKVEKKGRFNLSDDQIVESPLGIEFEKIARMVNSSKDRLSDYQKQKIKKTIMNNPINFLGSKSYQHVMNDISLKYFKNINKK